MAEPLAEALLKIVAGRSGHFHLESGHHAGRWLDLDSLFADQRRIEPFVVALAAAIQPHDVGVVCGPLVGGAFLAQLVARALRVEFCFTEKVAPAHDRGLYGVRYRLPLAVAQRLSGKRVAIVDDVMSAGSALRATYAELVTYGASPVVAGALLVLGDVGATLFAERGVAVEAVARHDFDIWLPRECPLCAANLPLEDVAR